MSALLNKFIQINIEKNTYLNVYAGSTKLRRGFRSTRNLEQKLLQRFESTGLLVGIPLVVPYGFVSVLNAVNDILMLMRDGDRKEDVNHSPKSLFDSHLSNNIR